MENALSRRNFIGGALIAGAGMVGAAALSGCAGKAYAKQDTTGIKWDKEADVVIVGGGAAGLWAAVQAYDNNLSAIVLEKQPEESAGGDVRCCGGYLFPISTDPNVLMSTGSFGEANEDLVYGIDEYGTDAIDWLVAHKYMEWADQPYVVIDGAGPGIYKGLLQAAIDAEAEILYETPGLSLITSDEGEVVGVVAGTKDEPLNVKAHYGVLLATGAYTMNKELMANFHLMGMDYFSVGSPHLTGDGLIMAGELGAKLSKLAKGYEIMYLTSKAASKEIGTGMFCLPPDNGSVMIVNQNGDRFIDEFCSFTHNKSTLPLFDFEGDMMQCRADGAHYVNSSMFEIVDQATFDVFTLGNANAGCSWANCMPEEVGGYIWSADNQAELEKGWIMRGETVADIAEAIGISAEEAAGLHRQVQCRLRCRSRCLWPQPREDGSFGRWPLLRHRACAFHYLHHRRSDHRRVRSHAHMAQRAHSPFVQRGQHRQRGHLYAAYRRQRLLGPGRRGDQQHRRAGAVGL